jgi:predicted nucleic-acid-binding Zn-ribbon protein
MGETFLKECPRCGSENLEYGGLVSFGPTKFRTNGWTLFNKWVDAVACQKCGHIELVLRDPPGKDAK